MKHKHHLQIAEAIAKLLDSQFGVGKLKFGLDPIIGLVPWIGDALTIGFSLYLFYIAQILNLPRSAKSQILRNIMIDAVLSVIPFVGDVGDFFFKSNQRNWEIIKKHAKIKDTIVEDAEIIS